MSVSSFHAWPLSRVGNVNIRNYYRRTGNYYLKIRLSIVKVTAAQFGEDMHTSSPSLVSGPCCLRTSRCSFGRPASGLQPVRMRQVTGELDLTLCVGKTDVGRRTSRREPLYSLCLLVCD